MFTGFFNTASVHCHIPSLAISVCCCATSPRPPLTLKNQTQLFLIKLKRSVAQHYDNNQLHKKSKKQTVSSITLHIHLPLENGLLWACSRVLITSRGVTKMKQKSFRNTLHALKMWKCKDALL